MDNVLTIDRIAELGEEIYAKKHRKRYEGEKDGYFLAIDVETETGYMAQYPEDALHAAEKSNPEGKFYLKRIGSSATFHVSYTGGMDVEGILQSA